MVDAIVAFMYPSDAERAFGADDALPGRYGGLARSNCPSLERRPICTSFDCVAWLNAGRINWPLA